jgi:hypothetical protein
MIPVQFFQNIWLNALTWSLLLSIPALIVLLYFLKLRRRPVEVPSTYLWAKTIEDLHVNSLWQRLRQSLLLFLQLLLLLLILLACLNPGWRGATLTGDRFIFLVDTSASMRATDVSPTRLEEAKRQIAGLIEEMKSGDVAMIISFSDVAHVEQSFTDNRNLLRQRLQQIQPTNHESELSEALRASAGLANPGQTSEAGTGDVQVAEAMPATLYIFSDGGFSHVPDFSLGNLNPLYYPIGQEQPPNVAIVAFSAERNTEKPGQMQAFARLENHGLDEVEVDVSLFVGSVLLDATSVSIPAEGSESVRFELEEVDQATLTLKIENTDSLEADNAAFAVINAARPARVLIVTPGNTALQRALSTEEAVSSATISYAEPDYLATPEYEEQAKAGNLDLIIFDQCAPAKMPLCNTLFIGQAPPSENWTAGTPSTTPIIIDTDRVHPLMQLIDMGNVRVVQAFPVTGPPGSITLIDSDVGALFVSGPREGFVDAVLGFEIIHLGEDGGAEFNTDWPIRRSFPVFVLNVLNYLGGRVGASAIPNVKPGASITLQTSSDADQLQVDSPSGSRYPVYREGQNRFPFAKTDELGIYQVREGKSAELPSQRFTVNLFSSRESNLSVADKIQLQYDEIKGQTNVQPQRVNAWKWLLLAALALLLFEWYVFNRRVYL